VPGQFSIVATMIALRHGLVKVVPFCFITLEWVDVSSTRLSGVSSMARLEDLKPGVKVKGIVPGQSVSIVEMENGQPRQSRYVHRPFSREPDFGVTSVNYDLKEL